MISYSSSFNVMKVGQWPNIGDLMRSEVGLPAKGGFRLTLGLWMEEWR